MTFNAQGNKLSALRTNEMLRSNIQRKKYEDELRIYKLVTVTTVIV